MNEIATEIPKKLSLIDRIRERFVKMKEQSVQAKLGVQMAKDAEATVGLNDKLRQRIDKIVIAEQKHTLSLDARVEAEWLKSYKRIYESLGEGKVKLALEKLAPFFAFKAKGERIVTRNIDRGLQAFALLSMRNGLRNTLNASINMNENPRASKKFADIATRDFVKAGITWSAPVEHISLESAKVAGFVGEKVVKIVNKILGR